MATYYVSNQSELTNALNSASPVDIIITNSFSLTATQNIANNKTVTITSDTGGTYVITRDPGFHNYMFSVNPSQNTLNLSNIIIDGNKAASVSEYPMLYVNGGTLNIYDGTVLRNNSTPGRSGGAVSATNNAHLNIYGGEISDNETNMYGGGLYIDKSYFLMENGTVQRNEGALGAGIYLNAPPNAVINGGNIIDNIGRGNSGAGISINGTLTINGGLISRNTGHWGAGIMVDRPSSGYGIGNLIVNGGEISYNVSDSGGGGIGVTSNADATINNARIIGNTATLRVMTAVEYTSNLILQDHC
jgi:hypothetical protein